jgi:Tol biopolymer transport system component
MWSPDGRYIAYRYTDCSSSAEDWQEGVVISDAEGNVITTFPTGRGWDIRWSPDSTRVAVWDSLFETIGVYGTDGVRQAQLPVPPWRKGSGDIDPWWMPDGMSLMVEDNVLLPLDGGTPRRLPEGAQAYSPGGDAPDGSPFAYVEEDHGSLVVVRSDGSGSVTLLTPERGTTLGAIGFSPKGDRVLFWRLKNGEFSLWSIGVDGSDARLVVAGTDQGAWLVLR